MLKKILLPVTMASFLLPSIAFGGSMLSMTSALEKLQNNGYKVKEIKKHSDYYHVDAYDKNCRQQHLRVDASGNISMHDGKPASNKKFVSIAEIATQMEGKGYKVKEIDLEHSHYDVKVMDKDGNTKFMRLDPVTGKEI